MELSSRFSPPVFPRFGRLLAAFLFLILPAVVPGTTMAVDFGGWKGLGPRVPGGSVLAAVADPISGTVYAAGPTGVSASHDGGATWIDSSTGLTFSYVASLVIDPRTPSVLYAGTDGGGIFKSIDGATSWTRLPSAPLAARVLAIAPLTPSTLYAAGSGVGVSKTTDGGRTWTLLDNVAVHEVIVIAIDPGASGTVYIGGQWDFSSQTALVKTTDGGVSWKPIPFGEPSTVLTLAIDPSSTGTVYLGSSSPTVLRSTDGGAFWLSITEGLPQGLVPLALAVDPRSPLTVYLGWNGGFSKSLNGGLFWENAGQGLGLPAGAGGPSPVLVVAIDPSAAGVLYAVADGLYRSSDGGETWSRRPGIFMDVNITIVATDPFDPMTIYAAGDARTVTLIKSIDGGATWSAIGSALSGATITDVLLDRTTPGRIYVNAIGTGVWKSTDGGATFLFSSAGLPLPVSTLAILSTGAAIVYASTPSGVFRSMDGAVTWQATGVPDPSVPQFEHLAAAGTTPPTLYGGTFGLWRSVDGGLTWKSAPSGLTGLVTSIVVDPLSPSTVSVSGRTPYYPQPIFFPPTDNGVARTTDGGDTWILRNSGLTATDVNFLAVDPRDTSHLFAATVQGVFASTNGGVGWFSVDDGLSAGVYPWLSVGSLAVDIATPPHLYAGTTGGVFRRSAVVTVPPCVTGATVLCLNGGRYGVSATWTTVSGSNGLGQSFPLTADTGAFWFFSANNIELVVKVVDGRAFNGHIWIFAGALTDVFYTIQVTDSVTGEVRSYTNPAGRIASFADTAAF